MIRVMIVDDHLIILEGLVALLQELPDIDVVDSMGTAEEALSHAGQFQPDVILLDLELPGMNGLDAMRDLIRAYPMSKILIFTGYNSDDRIYHAIKSGAAGYLQKGRASAEEIADAIRNAYKGTSPVDPRVAQVMAEYPAMQSIVERLSPRELEVLQRISEGMPNKQIAGSLHITEHTVKYHIASIFQKLGAENRAQAVTLAVQHGLLKT